MFYSHFRTCHIMQPQIQERNMVREMYQARRRCDRAVRWRRRRFKQAAAGSWGLVVGHARWVWVWEFGILDQIWVDYFKNWWVWAWIWKRSQTLKLTHKVITWRYFVFNPLYKVITWRMYQLLLHECRIILINVLSEFYNTDLCLKVFQIYYHNILLLVTYWRNHSLVCNASISLTLFTNVFLFVPNLICQLKSCFGFHTFFGNLRRPIDKLLSPWLSFFGLPPIGCWSSILLLQLKIFRAQSRPVLR